MTGEFYTKKEHFPGFARPYVFNAEVLLKYVGNFFHHSKNALAENVPKESVLSSCIRVGRKTEAKDAARGALKSPWWTLGCKYEVLTFWLISFAFFLIAFCFKPLALGEMGKDKAKNTCKKLILELVLAHIQEVANIAQWEDEQIEYLKEKVTEEGKLEDLKKGKAPAQVFHCSLWITLKLSSRQTLIRTGYFVKTTLCI